MSFVAATPEARNEAAAPDRPGHPLPKADVMRKLLLAPVFLVAATAIAGMYDQPYALVERGDASEPRKEARLAVTKVDGKSTRDPRTTDPLPPGKHVISLHVESARGEFRPEFLNVEMDLEACTRYRIVAAYENRLGPDWKPKVYTEPIPECTKKFAKKAAAAK
jgi:hypothetical protein